MITLMRLRQCKNGVGSIFSPQALLQARRTRAEPGADGHKLMGLWEVGRQPPDNLTPAPRRPDFLHPGPPTGPADAKVCCSRWCCFDLLPLAVWNPVVRVVRARAARPHYW